VLLSMDKIEFNIPYTCNESADNVRYLVEHPEEVNKGSYVQKCQLWLEEQYPGYTAYLTSSCTRALEMAALSMNLQPDDEIILSPFTYVGVGNAFANYGAKLVFVDVHPENMNINADLIESKITSKTRAVIAMHYASVGCEVAQIAEICKKHQIILIEDNAQSMHAHLQGKLLGTFGDFTCISFDLLKNISCNEGGVLLCKKNWEDAVDVVYENGTNRTAFRKGKVAAYEWMDRGSKFVMSEYTAAVLHPVLQKSATICKERRAIWDALMMKIYSEEKLKDYVPSVMFKAQHNGHIAYLKFKSVEQRDNVMNYMNAHEVPSFFHYVSMDDSIAGKRFGKASSMPTNAIFESNCLLRLPMHNHLSSAQIGKIVATLTEAVSIYPTA
jgi:dTDP-4-amino-4,6-dideoxygalactose transaminase